MTGTDADASDVLDESLQPDWPNQVAYNIVPCKGTSDYCWVRKSDCTTIGMLLRALGPYKSATKNLCVLQYTAQGELQGVKRRRNCHLVKCV